MSDTARIIRYNEAQRYPDATIKKLQELIGVTPDGVWGPRTCAALRLWQKSRYITADGMAGPGTRAELAVVWREERELTDAEILKLAVPTIHHESGGRWDAANRDGEYEGRFDKDGKFNWASKHGPGGGTHVGLSLGPIQVTQDGGALGTWLTAVNRDHPDVVCQHLGEYADEILTMTTQRSRRRSVVAGQGPGKRSPRVRHLSDGKDLWESPHVDAMRALARDAASRPAWNEIATDQYMRPQLELCKALGLETAGELAVVFDVAVQYGGGGARKRMRYAARGGRLDIQDFIGALAQARQPRRRRVYNRSEWWVVYPDY